MTTTIIIMEIIKTQKGGEAQIWQGSKSTQTLNRNMANGKKYWRCSKRTCPAKVTSEGNEVTQQTNSHNHPVDGVEVNSDHGCGTITTTVVQEPTTTSKGGTTG